MNEKERIEELVRFLNKCCDEYYNKNNPTLSDAQYDALFDELSALEQKTGYVLPDSPTRRAGYEVLSELKKVTHDIPLLSLAKTKSAADVYDMAKVSDGYLALKMDGLTVKITYENGEIVAAATRGDGAVGEDITHNARVFTNVPKKISYKNRLVVSGEAFIDIPTFERINETIEEDEEKYSTPRNLASGSVRQLDSAICAARGVSFMPFNVLEGFPDEDNKLSRLKRLNDLGFQLIPHDTLTAADSVDSTAEKIAALKNTANKLGYPIDGIVFTYSGISFGKTLGKTSHHFKDGIAYKFGDPHFETTLKSIIWNISRTGQLTPIAEFDAVEIDNTNVERASLHNITFIENLKLIPGDRILVSKRNMIIPHVEENKTGGEENRGSYTVPIPQICPVCRQNTVIKTTQNGEDTVKVLYCSNKNCPGRQIKKYTHFVSKTALDIEGLSEQTLIRFIGKGWINSLADIFSLPEHKEEIVTMDGFGEKSYENLGLALEKAKTTSLWRLLVAVNINLLGKSGAKLIDDYFGGDVNDFCTALKENFDFTALDGIGNIMQTEIYNWANNAEKQAEFRELLGIMTIEKSAASLADQNGFFYGKTIVITGKFSTLSRDELTEKMVSLGAKATGSVSGKTDYLLCGEDAGSKLDKAKKLGVKILTEEELRKIIEL